MTISATTQGLRPGVCTSSNRPASPFEGQMIYETDTDKVLVYNGTAWYPNWNNRRNKQYRNNGVYWWYGT